MSVKRKELLYWIWASRALGAGKAGVEALLDTYGSPYGAFCADGIDTEEIRGLSRSARLALSKKDLDEACGILDLCEREGIGILTYGDERYPDMLRSLKDAPSVLYYRGTLPDLNRKMCVALVGTRSMSEYGRNCAYKIAYEIAEAGAVVVSGMASGIDAVCSAATIAAKGETIAFLGGGVDVVYPKQNKPLYEEICRHGAVISEYPPKTRPFGYHFPIRNRLISGTSQATLVIEAGVRSGALITARQAISQGRSVYALLTATSVDTAEGAQILVEYGAKPLLSAEKVIADFSHIYPRSVRQRKASADAVNVDMSYLSRLGVDSLDHSENKRKEDVKRQSTRIQSSFGKNKDLPTAQKPPLDEEVLSAMSPAEAAVMRCFLKEASIASDQFYTLPFEANEISMALTCLEIAGRIKKTPGSFYERC